MLFVWMPFCWCQAFCGNSENAWGCGAGCCWATLGLLTVASAAGYLCAGKYLCWGTLLPHLILLLLLLAMCWALWIHVESDLWCTWASALAEATKTLALVSLLLCCELAMVDPLFHLVCGQVAWSVAMTWVGWGPFWLFWLDASWFSAFYWAAFFLNMGPFNTFLHHCCNFCWHSNQWLSDLLLGVVQLGRWQHFHYFLVIVHCLLCWELLGHFKRGRYYLRQESPRSWNAHWLWFNPHPFPRQWGWRLSSFTHGSESKWALWVSLVMTCRVVQWWVFCKCWLTTPSQCHFPPSSLSTVSSGYKLRPRSTLGVSTISTSPHFLLGMGCFQIIFSEVWHLFVIMILQHKWVGVSISSHVFVLAHFCVGVWCLGSWATFGPHVSTLHVDDLFLRGEVNG